MQATHHECFSVPRQKVGDRLNRELARLNGGGNGALNDQELLLESSWLSNTSESFPVYLKSFHAQASPPTCEGEVDSMEGCIVRAVRETRGGGGSLC